MRIRTMTALGFATASVAAGLAIGTAANAGGTDPGAEAGLRIVQEDGGTAAAAEDCPEKGGASPDGASPDGASPDGGGAAIAPPASF